MIPLEITDRLIRDTIDSYIKNRCQWKTCQWALTVCIDIRVLKYHPWHLQLNRASELGKTFVSGLGNLLIVKTEIHELV